MVANDELTWFYGDVSGSMLAHIRSFPAVYELEFEC